jgi:uncharacterized membrane protein
MILIGLMVLCITHPGDLSLLAMVLFLPFATIVMSIYLLFAWRRLTVKKRLNIFFSITAWCGLFYGIISNI